MEKLSDCNRDRKLNAPSAGSSAALNVAVLADSLDVGDTPGAERDLGDVFASVSCCCRDQPHLACRELDVRASGLSPPNERCPVVIPPISGSVRAPSPGERLSPPLSCARPRSLMPSRHGTRRLSSDAPTPKASFPRASRSVIAPSRSCRAFGVTRISSKLCRPRQRSCRITWFRPCHGRLCRGGAPRPA